MLGISITSVGFIALLLTGASGLVMNPGHRRHAANLNLLGERVSQPVALLPRQIMAERRSTRQKRCVRQPTSSDPPSPSPVASSDAPANVAPAPTQDQTTTTTTSSSEQQVQPTPDVTPDTSSGSGGDTFSGQLTFYEVALGACGYTNSDSDMIAAASMLLFDGFDGYTGADPNDNPICGKQVQITYNSNTIVVTIVDRCVGCARDDLDLSPTAFSLLASQDLGRLSGATWYFL
jgi:hypothetical protein